MTAHGDSLRRWWDNQWTERRETAGRTDWSHIAAQADEIIETLGLVQGQSLLDVGCGTGALDVELASRGFAVTGLDISPVALDIARSLAQERKERVEWICADMRELPPGPFDAVLLWDVILGVLPSDADNARVLAAIAPVLTPGGRLYLEVYTKEFALVHGIEGGLAYCQATDSFVSRDGDPHAPEMRLYSREALVGMLASCGLRLTSERYWGWRRDPPGPPYRGWKLVCTKSDLSARDR